MTMGTNDHAQKPPRSRTRSTKRDVLIYGLLGTVCSLLFVTTFPSATTWYLVVGSCLLAITAVVSVAKAIIAMRQDG